MAENKFFDSLSEKLKERLLACETKEEMEQVLREEGIVLDAEVLEAVSGGRVLVRQRPKSESLESQVARNLSYLDPGNSMSRPKR